MQNRLKLTSISTAFISLLCLLFSCFYHKTFWFDEAYSIGMIKLSFNEIWNMTAHDVHPPLYYFILKIFTSVFGDSLTSMHMCSLLAIVLILLLGFFPIKRIFGSNISYIFTLLISLLPVIIFFAIEIRMYSWLAFFVLATAVYGYDALLNAKYASYIKLTFFAICASYTHNYGLASVLTIYFLLWVACIFKRKRTVNLALSTILFLIIFSFWIPNLYLQMTLVKKEYWIRQLTIYKFIKLPYYFLGGFGTFYNKIICVIFLLLSTCIIYLSFLNRKFINKQKIVSGLFFICIFLIVYLVTGIISILYKPILIDRYLIAVIGCLILGLSLLISSLNVFSQKIKIAYAAIFLCLVSLYVLKFINEVTKYTLDNKKEETLIKYFNKNIESPTDNYSIIGSADQFLRLSTLYIVNPKNKYYFYYTKEDRARAWTPFPFDIKEIYSLKDEEKIIFIVNDLEQSFERDNFKRSVDSLYNDATFNYNIIRIDTISNVEIKMLSKKTD